MKLSKERYPVSVLKEVQDSIDVRPEYQRPLVWTLKQKRLLIDSILRGYDVPKMYWHRQPDEEQFEFHVVDGQQRLTTIWEFCNDGFALPKDSDPVDGISTAKLKYSGFNTELKKRLHLYSFDVVIVEEAIQNDEEDEVREMFLRLQNGTTLKAQEKRNAMTGRMRAFVKEVAQHPFFESCKFSNTRFTYDHIAAQMTCLELAGEPVSLRDSDLNKMYAEQTDFDPKGNVAKKVRRTLDYLTQAFPEHTRELERYNAVTLYSLASSLIDNYVHQGTEKKLADWFIAFETERRADMEKDEDSRDVQLVEYQRLTSYSTDAAESLAKRLEHMQRRFFLAAPDIELVDPTRIFSEAQRLAIYRRDGARCQLRIKCDGSEKLKWNNWHADHKVPHSAGGKTTVENGQVACPDCNFAKGAVG
ncbi:HNH endonuclease family protein [Dinoroseobacter sp. S76]|uniref:HNH endonuclease family protein n=1 Tax=Dinoroseobacter sp. S76 TaxID=3415124 RepID=UPI003C7ECEC9